MRLPSDHRDVPFEEELLEAEMARLVRRNELLWAQLRVTEDMLAQVLLTTGRVRVTPLTMITFSREDTVITRHDESDGSVNMSAAVSPTPVGERE